MMSMKLNIGDTVKLEDGLICEIIGLPNGYLSNGSYEVSYENKRRWVKEDEILYVMDINQVDDIENYFEIIYDENGVNIIPKDIVEVVIDDQNEEMKTIEMMVNDQKHGKITFHIGNTDIKFEEPEEEEKEPKKYKLL